MTGNAGEGLQGQVQGEQLIQHPGRVDVVVKKAACVLVVQLVKVYLAAVGKGGMTDIVTQCNGLDQIQIQVQCSADGPGDPGHQLDMEAPTGDVVVFDQGEHLGLIGIAVVVGAVHDPVDILGKIGTPDGGRFGIVLAAQCTFVGAGEIQKAPVSLFLFDPGRQSGR